MLSTSDNIILQANWMEMRAFFMQGNPPLVLQLLCLNTVVLILIILRRMNNQPSLRPETARIVQAFLIAANFGVVFQQDLLGQAVNFY